MLSAHILPVAMPARTFLRLASTKRLAVTAIGMMTTRSTARMANPSTIFILSCFHHLCGLRGSGVRRDLDTQKSMWCKHRRALLCGLIVY